MKVLIVEDDFTSRKMLQKFLGRYGECDVAVDGKEALTAYQEAFQSGDPYTLICLDIMMPEMDGHEVLKRVRSFENEHGVTVLSGVKVIMTSALGDSKNVLGAFKAGCEAYLEKPIDCDKLVAELAKLGLIQH